jgi:AmmeMemoRadiSam system protein A
MPTQLRPDDPTVDDALDVPLDAHPLTPDHCQALLDRVRVVLAVACAAEPPSLLGRALDADGLPDLRAAAFVTLTRGDALRGCMGNLDAGAPLVDNVTGAAMAAARYDPRFDPVTATELPTLHVEISVLGPAGPIRSPAEFRPGVDGVILEVGPRRALLLPEVATEAGWDALQMFTAVCRKAGLPPRAWADPRARLLTFRTRRFGGSAVAEELQVG